MLRDSGNGGNSNSLALFSSTEYEGRSAVETSICLLGTSAETGCDVYTGDIGGFSSGSLGGLESTLLRFE